MGLEVVKVGANIPLDQIRTSRQKVRGETAEKGISDLLASIKAHGQIHALSVLQISEGEYELINGHRRYTAALKGGLETLRANVYRVPAGKDGERELLIQQHLYAANMAEPLIPLEKARMFDALRRDFGYDAQQIANSFEGETAETVDYALSFLSIPEEVLDLIEANPGKVNESQLRVLAEYSSNQKKSWRAKPEEIFKIVESLIRQDNKLAAVDSREFEKQVRGVVKARRDATKAVKQVPARSASTRLEAQSDPVKLLFKRIEQLEKAVRAFCANGVEGIVEIRATDKREASKRLYEVAGAVDDFIGQELNMLALKEGEE